MAALAHVGSAASLSDLYRRDADRQPRSHFHIALVATLLREFAALMVEETEQSEPTSRRAMRQWLHTGEIQTAEGPKTPLEVLSDRKLAIAALNDVRAAALGE